MSSSIKIKINKVIPLDDFPYSKAEPYVVNDTKYVPSPTRLDENYTGYPMYLMLTITLPTLNHDFEYLKVDVNALPIRFVLKIFSLPSWPTASIKHLRTWQRMTANEK